MRLTDTDTLKEKIEYSFHKHEKVSIDTVINTFLSEQCAPTVDAEPVKHGQWLAFSDDDQDEGVFLCSLCENVLYIGEDIYTSDDAATVFHYCPNCGAKMNKTKTIENTSTQNNQNNQEQKNLIPVENNIGIQPNSTEKIKIVHSKDGAYDIYNGDTDEYIMTRCSADNILSFLAIYNAVNIEFIDKTLIP